LLSHTDPAHKDYAQLTSAYTKMTEVAKYVNERKREFENLASMLEVQQRLLGKLDVRAIILPLGRLSLLVH